MAFAVREPVAEHLLAEAKRLAELTLGDDQIEGRVVTQNVGPFYEPWFLHNLSKEKGPQRRKEKTPGPSSKGYDLTIAHYSEDLPNSAKKPFSRSSGLILQTFSRIETTSVVTI